MRVINNFPLRDHITPHYANLGLIKLPDIVKLNTCQLIYDHFVDKKPSNFTLALVSEQHNYDTRSASLQHPCIFGKASLVFGSTVFWNGEFISNWKFPDCVHFFGAWARQVNSRHVRTHKKNSGDAVRRLGKIIQSIFVPNQEPEFAWPFGNGPVRVGTQGLFRPCLKTFVAPFLPVRLTAPGSPSMCNTYTQ